MTNVRLRLDLAYDGTDFHGWARQKGICVQSKGFLRTISHDPAPRRRADRRGRTDAGVHSAGQVAHFDVPSEALDQRSIDGDPAKLVRRLAKLLPEDVRVHACTAAPEGFDARFGTAAPLRLPHNHAPTRRTSDPRAGYRAVAKTGGH